jgi:predicted RNase H-like nuclease (RuvC/YqgF family)
MRKLTRRVEDVENEIEALEREIADMDAKLIDPSSFETVGEEFFRSYNEKKKLLNEKMTQWGEFTQELELFLKNN